MFRSLKKLTRKLFRTWRLPPVIKAVRADSLTYLTENALCDLYEQVALLERRGAGGILIEAGCALGGSAIVIAAAKAPERPLYVYDVFDQIPPPSDRDGPDVRDRYEVITRGEASGFGGKPYYGYEENLYEQVTENFRMLGLPAEENNVHLKKGLFRDTLHVEEPVVLAHIDGDWYESVMTCLERIEPRLIHGGVLVIDDYKHWSGCPEAVDEYFADKRDRYAFIERSRLHIVRR